MTAAIGVAISLISGILVAVLVAWFLSSNKDTIKRTNAPHKTTIPEDDYQIEEVVYGNGKIEYRVYYKRKQNGDLLGYLRSFKSLREATEYVGLKIQEKKDNEVISKRIVE